MIELLYRLFIGHVHTYKIIDKHQIGSYKKASDALPTRITETITQECSVCGKLKITKVDK